MITQVLRTCFEEFDSPDKKRWHRDKPTEIAASHEHLLSWDTALPREHMLEWLGMKRKSQIAASHHLPLHLQMYIVSFSND